MPSPAKKKNVKECSVLFKERSVLFLIYIYIYMSIYIYIYFYIYLEKRTERSPVLLQKNETFSRSFPFFAEERCVLFRSLQKNIAFFSVLCKRTLRSLHSLSFFRKERKRTERSFVSHKSPKTREKNGTFFFKNRK